MPAICKIAETYGFRVLEDAACALGSYVSVIGSFWEVRLMDMQAVKIDKDDIALKGQEIYDKTLKEKLERDHRGEIVAIEVDTGDYFLGKTGVEATRRARQKYPNAVCYVLKIGFPVVHKFR